MKPNVGIQSMMIRRHHLIRFDLIPFLAILSMALFQPTSSSGQQAGPRLTITESARATMSEPGGTARFNNSIGALAYSPDGSMLAAGMRDPNLILLLDPSTLAVRGRLVGHIALVLDLKFSPDGKFLVSGGLDGTMRVWDVATKRQRLLIDKFQGNVMAVAVSPDGTRIYTGEMARGRGTAQVWDAGDGRLINSLKDYDHGIESLQISPDGLTMATSSRDKTIRLWDVATFKPKNRFDANGPFASALAYMPDGKSLAAAFNDRTLRMFDAETMTEKYKILTDAKMFLFISVSPDGSILATASENRLQLWRSSDGSPLASVPDTGGRVMRIQFSPDGRSIVVGGPAGFIRVFRLEQGGK